jgi:lysophospholipase L1-like esterase
VLGKSNVNKSEEPVKETPQITYDNFPYNNPDASYSVSPPWLHRTVEYHINSDGLNSNSNYSVEKPENTLRIVAMGDSHTYGDFVNTYYNYPSQLERLLNSKYKHCIDNFEVLNLGISTFDIAYSTHLYKLKGGKYSPDLILWYVIYNDFYELSDVIRGYTLSCMETEEAKSLPKDILASDYCWEKGIEYMQRKYDVQDIFNLNTDVLKNFLSNLNTKIVIIAYKDEDKQIINTINSLVDNKKIFLFNKFHFYDIDRLLPIDPHPTEKGYQYLANLLGEYLNETFIKCN